MIKETKPEDTLLLRREDEDLLDRAAERGPSAASPISG